MVIPKIEKEIGILSFAGNREQILMWSHYANSHKGFCIGLNKKELQESIRPLLITEGKFIKLYDVLYQKSYPQINPLKVGQDEYFALPLTIKSKAWEYEDEVRLIFKDGADELLKVEKKIFQDITLGCRMYEDNQNEILEIVKTEFDRLPVYKAMLSNDEFSLVFDRIQ
ncbi:MAG: DUF2971 domain-containing protein [Candidatus Paceibacterota bacterium]